MSRSWRAIFGLVISVAASAATLQQLSMDDMARQSTAIVRARVIGTSVSFTGSTIYTHYKLQASETWKGSTPLEVMVPGGVANGYQQTFPGVPLLQAGSEYVLFLWTSQAGITHIIGLTQGLFSLDRQNDGSVLANRRGVGETMLDATGRQVEDRGMQLRVADLKSRVLQALDALPGAVK